MGGTQRAKLPRNNGYVAHVVPARLPDWEDASGRGLVETAQVDGRSIVRVTPAGFALLKEKSPQSCEHIFAYRGQQHLHR
jgi:hypothetical protein